MSNNFRDLYEDDEGHPFEVEAELVYDASTDTLLPETQAGHDFIIEVAGQSTPPSAAGFAPFSEWQKQNEAFTVNKLAEDKQYEDAPADAPGPFDQG